MYKYTALKPSSSGGGLWQDTGLSDESYCSHEDLITACTIFYPHNVDRLCEHVPLFVEDIRGLVQSSFVYDDDIYAALDDYGDAHYFAIVEVEDEKGGELG